MASLEERIRVNRAHGQRNTMTDYGNSRDYDIDYRDETKDRIERKLRRLGAAFRTCCNCGQTDRAFELATDIAYWQNKLARL